MKFSFLGSRDVTSLQIRSLNAFLLSISISAFIVSIYDLITGLYVQGFGQIGIALITSAIFYMARFRNHYASARTATAVFHMTGYPFFWIFHSPSPEISYMLLFALIVTVSIIWKKNQSILLIGLLLLETVILYYLEISHLLPDVGSEPILRGSNLLVNVIILSGALFFFMMNVMEDYNYERNLVNEKNQELYNLNQQLELTNSQLKKLSVLDGLTCLYNRRYFEEYLYDELCQARRSKSSLSLLMIDIDNFKYYNDTYGHLEGDRVLKLVGVTIQKILKRPADLVARFGGEEFVVILPDTDSKGAYNVAELIRLSIENVCRDKSGRDVTISTGVASLHGPANCDIADFIIKADRALYNAKSSGKNCCRVYEEN